MKQGS